MALNEKFVAYIENQLSEFGEFQTRKMFGGVGFFKQKVMFGKIGGDTFRLKVDESNKKQYEEKGMKPFYSEKKKKGMPYWEVPEDVIEDKEELAKWVHQSFEIAKRAAANRI